MITVTAREAEMVDGEWVYTINGVSARLSDHVMRHSSMKKLTAAVAEFDNAHPDILHSFQVQRIMDRGGVCVVFFFSSLFNFFSLPFFFLVGCRRRG